MFTLREPKSRVMHNEDEINEWKASKQLSELQQNYTLVIQGCLVSQQQIMVTKLDDWQREVGVSRMPRSNDLVTR